MNQKPPLKCVEPDIRMSGCTKQNNNWQHNSHDVVPLSLTRPFGAGSVQYGSSSAGHVAAVGGGPRMVCGHDRVLGLCALHGTSRRLGELGARSLPFANCIREPLANFPTVVEVANCDGLASRPASILIVIQTTFILAI